MEFHRAVFDFLDERHDERMAQVLRDQGLPENTLVARDHDKEIPDWMKPCKIKGEACWHKAGEDACKRLECIDNFIKCVKEHHPTPIPSPSPLQVRIGPLCFFKAVEELGTLGARDFSCAVSGVGHVSIVTRTKNFYPGYQKIFWRLRRSFQRSKVFPSALREKKPLVPRVGAGQFPQKIPAQ